MLTEEEILSDPAVSHWLKKAIWDLQQRDPVDALNDVEFLLDFLKRKEISSYTICGEPKS